MTIELLSCQEPVFTSESFVLEEDRILTDISSFYKSILLRNTQSKK